MPSPVKGRWTPKADGKQLPAGILTVRDRVIQIVVIEPIFEADFQSCSYGFQPKKSARQALEAIRETGNQGHSFVVDEDIQSRIDVIDRSISMELVKERISDSQVLLSLLQHPNCHPDETVLDHAAISHRHQLLDEAAHQAVFTFELIEGARVDC